MQKIKRIMMGGGLLIAVVLASGCASTAIEPDWTAETITFGDRINPPAEPRLKNPDNPKEYILYCLALSERGRHETAGDFLMDAAGKFDSHRNEFAISAYAGAANEYFYAGDMEKFRNAVWTLKKKADRYQTASFDSATCALLALGDVIEGESIPREYTPRPLRELYELNKK